MDYPGAFQATKKDGSIYYRSSITIDGKHISLGSFSTAPKASRAYKLAGKLMRSQDTKEDYSSYRELSFDKFMILLNLRDNGIYFSSPVYLKSNYFLYYLDENTELIFDREDLFYYTSHKIIRRGGHLFVNDFGAQVSILSRYGIHPYSVIDRDYTFINRNPLDFRRENIEIVNPYHGVFCAAEGGRTGYLVKIHVKGNYKVGFYDDIVTAAIAYNKAADVLKKAGIDKQFELNYIEGISMKEYADIYACVTISKSLYKPKK